MSVLVEKEPSRREVILLEVKEAAHELTNHLLTAHAGRGPLKDCDTCMILLQKGNDACSKVPFRW